MSYIAAAAIIGGSTIGASMLGGKSKKVKIPPQVSGSMQWLYDLLQQPAPTIPTRQIAGMTPTEQAGQGILAEFAGAGPPEGYTAGMAELMKIIGGEYDPRTSPYYKGFREASLEAEEGTVNQLSRGMQKRGMYTSSPSIAQEGKLRRNFATDRLQLLGSLFESERNKQFAAIPELLEFGRFDVNYPLTKLDAISKFGALPRNLNQQQLDAALDQIMQTIMFDYEKKAPIAGGILGATMPVQGPESSTLSQIMPLLQSLLQTTAFMPGGTPKTAGYTAPQGAYLPWAQQANAWGGQMPTMY